MKKLLFFLLAMIIAIQGWSQVISTFPWTEGFETGLTNWTQQFVSGTNSWSAASSASQITSAQEGTQFARYSHSSTGNTTKLVSPVFDISALTNPTMFFWYTQSDWSGDQNTIKVYYRNDTVSTSTWTEILYLSQNTPSWTMVTLPLTNGSSTYQIAFEGYDDYGYPVGLDNVTILDLTCPAPTNIIASNPTLTGVDLGWTDATGSTWNIQYMLATETDWANATTISGVANPYTFTTLNSSTAYKARVQTDCSTDQSLWSSTITFATTCDAITTFPWNEGFEVAWSPAVSPGNLLAPNCWTNIDKGSGSTNIWSRGTTAHTGTGAAQMYTDNNSQNNDWLISPKITLTGNERLRFWAQNYSATSSEVDEISVWISDGIITSIDTTNMGVYDSIQGFTQVFQTGIPIGAWQQYEINLSQYSGDRYIAFVRRNEPNNGWYLRLDDVEISELPSCMRPTNVTISSITTTDAEVSWVNGNSADASWWVYYKQSTSTTYDSVLVTSNPYVLTSLLPSSGYDIYVATDCGTQLSEASPIVNFRTLCDEISTLPWSDNIDTYGTSSGSFPPCWTRPVINNPYTAYPSIDGYTYHTSPASIKFQTVTTTPTYSVTPAFNADLNTLMVSFWLKAEGVNNQSGTITVGVMSNPNDTTTFEAVQLISPSTTNWIEYRIMLAGIQLQGSGNYIAFKHNSNADNWYYWLDDVEVDEIPACPNTYDLTSTILSATSVELDWMDNGNTIGWVIAYGDSTAFDPSTATQTMVLSSTDPIPYIVSSLTPQTPYSFAVRQNCTDGAWSNIVTIVTPAIAATLPYTHDFENVTENNAWTFINGTQTNQWIIGTAADTLGTTGLYISNDAGVSNAYTVGTSRVYAYRDFEVPTGAGELELSFDWRAQGGAAHNDFLRMYLVPLDANITAGNIPAGGLDISAQIGNYAGLGEHWLSMSNVWQHKTMRINSIQFPNLAGRTWRLLVHWRNESSATTDIQPPAAVDNIQLSVVSCPTPSALVASNPTTTSIDLAWQENGQATNWIIEYKENSSSTWNQANANSNPYTLTGLNNSSNYQARVRSLCSTNDTSLTSLTISFNTACDIITTFPWSEGFETSWIASQAPGNASAPNCWINVNKGNGSSNLWTLSTSYYHSGTGSAQIYTDNSNQNNDWLITPELSLTGNERLRFWAMNYSTTTSELDEISIWVSDADLTIDITNMGILDSISGFTEVYQTGIPVGNWQQYEVNLNQYSGNRYIAFVRKHTPDNGWYLRLDDVLVESIPACARPTNVVSVSNTQNSIELSWTNGNTTDASWYVYYRPSGTTDYDSVLVNSNPYILSGLISSTVYDIYVKTDCSIDLSEASPVVNLATACGIISSFPWAEGFESTNWAPAVAPGNKPAPNCWTVVNKGDSGTDYFWKHSSSGYAGDGSHSGNGHAMCYTDYGTTNHNDWLITPQIALTGGERLRFWAMRAWNGTSEPDEISVYISDVDVVLDTTGMGQYGNLPNFTQIFTQMLPSGSWQEYEVNLSQYSGNRYIAFVRQNTPDGYYLRLDDVLIDALPSCAKPTNVVSVNSNQNDIEIGWTNGNTTDASWYVYYRPSGATDYDSVLANSNPYILGGLTSATTYDIYVRTNCGTELSEASPVVTFATTCYAGAISTFPWTEGFESGLICWQQEYVSGAIDWTNEDNYYSSSTPAHGGQKIAYFYNTSGSKTKLVSPLLDISGLATPYVSFWHLQSAWGSDQDELKVFYRASSDSSWTQLFHSTSSITAWQLDSVALPSASSTYQIAFEGFGDYGYGVGLDDVTVYDPSGSACTPPTNLAVSNIQNTSATISWIPSGTESQWQVRLEATGTPVDVSSTTYTFPSTLTPATHYTYFVRANCGTNYSAWVQDTFTTTAGHQAVQVTTLAPSAITQTNATFQGTYVQGTEAVTAIGFEYKTNVETTWTDQAVTTIATPFNYAITTLIANTNYEVRAYSVTPTDGRVYGATLSFATPAIVPPTVTTLTTTGITQTNATFNGTIAQGSEEINARGFEYKLPSQAWPDANIISATGTNNITASVTNLQHSTTYEVRAYARTASMTNYYGTTLTFTTQTPGVTPPTVVTNLANPVNDRNATLNGTITAGSEAITNQGFEWKAASASTWTPVTVVPVNDTITYQLTGIEPSTLYEFKSFATTASGTEYGTTQTFQTLGLNTIDGSVITVMMYPNPASQETKLVVKGLQGDVKITISDVQGRIINTINTRAHNNKVEETINVSNMANGVYYVRLQNHQVSRTQKLIVK